MARSGSVVWIAGKADSCDMRSIMDVRRVLLLFVLVFGVAIEGQIGTDSWCDAIAGFQWRW